MQIMSADEWNFAGRNSWVVVTSQRRSGDLAGGGVFVSQTFSLSKSLTVFLHATLYSSNVPV